MAESTPSSLSESQRTLVDAIIQAATGQPAGAQIQIAEDMAAGDDVVYREAMCLLQGIDDLKHERFLQSNDSPLREAASPAASEAPTQSKASDRQPPIASIGERPGDQIGPYKLMSVLGEGGFGVVYLAERREPHIQRVALKIIKPGMDSRAVIARFEAERQALAVMDHPNIAKVFDAGATSAGRPYFVMEHVQGEPITQYCDRHNYTIKQRLELFIPVCEAVQHAHMKGIIHRDIKPSNILVMVKDGHAIPKVIDFGVAKAISHTLTDKTIFTELGQIIGTPEYMSPEQAEMGAIDIDTRTDVYSLGVVLYELLTGLLPFDPKTLRSKGYAEIQRIIREVEPPKPSTRLTSVGVGARALAQHRQENLLSLARILRRELEWIPLKAIRKDRTSRYSSPLQLASDLHRYLKGDVLEAGPVSAFYSIRKFTIKHIAALSLSGIIVVCLLIFSAIYYNQFLQARSASRLASIQRDDALMWRGTMMLFVSVFSNTPSETISAQHNAVQALILANRHNTAIGHFAQLCLAYNQRNCEFVQMHAQKFIEIAESDPDGLLLPGLTMEDVSGISIEFMDSVVPSNLGLIQMFISDAISTRFCLTDHFVRRMFGCAL